MDDRHARLLRKLEGIAKAFETAATAGAEYYANGGGAARPGVAKHFTPGNQQRYGWPPLSAAYAAEKARNIVRTSPGAGLSLHPDARRQVDAIKAERDAEIRGVGQLDPTVFGATDRKRRVAQIRARHQARIDRIIAFYSGGRAGSKLDHATGSGRLDPTVFGAQAAQGVLGTNLPMLVRTGKLRDAVTTIRHQITREGDTAYIRFDGLPAYATYLQKGTAKMPRRSPVDPGSEDEAEIRAAIQRHLDAALGTGTRGLPVSGTTIPGAARTL